MSDVPISVPLMLDCSESMSPVCSVMLNDAKAFVRTARPGDQIAVVAFQNDAWAVYPVPAALTTVDPQLIVTATAATAIGTLSCAGGANIGAAIDLCASLMPASANATQAFTLISDGWWSVGPDPASVLPDAPPIFICGVGPSVNMSSYAAMIARNPRSLYFYAPTEEQMMQIFNEIRSLADDTALPLNVQDVYYSGGYRDTFITVSDGATALQISVVWEDDIHVYTTGAVGKIQLAIVVIDPSGREDARPVATDVGYAIFYIEAPEPGQWRLQMRYQFDDPVSVTIAAFEYGTDVRMTASMPAVAQAGSELTLSARVIEDGTPVEGARVQAEVVAPSIAVPDALRQYAAELSRVTPSASLLAGGMPEDVARLETWRRELRGSHGALSPRRLSLSMLAQGDGTYTAQLPAAIAGSYHVQVTATGHSRATGKAFSRTAMAASLVMDR